MLKGGCGKGAAKRACGETVVQTPKMDNKKLSTKTPQLDSPRKIHTYWIKATCDSRFCVLDVSDLRTYSLELTDGLPRHSPSGWDQVTKD